MTNLVSLYDPTETYQVDRFQCENSSGRTRLIIYDTNGIQHNYFNWQETATQFYFVNKTTGNLIISQANTNTYIYSMVYTTENTQKNFFYESIDELHNQPIFNWAEHTGIYTAINGMTEGLDMGENNTLALLLSYWAICTAVYIVFDIVIVMFTKITHFIGEK